MDFVVTQETHHLKQIEIDVISRRWIPFIKNFFENQDNQKKFEEWKSKVNKKEPFQTLKKTKRLYKAKVLT